MRVVQLPPAESATPEPGTEAGVIEDARARQRRQRRVGAAVIVALLLVGAPILGGTGSGGGGGAGNNSHGHPSGSGPPAGSALSGSARLFPGGPSTQPNEGVVTDACALAPPNRYLPPWSGCVTARVTDLSGSGRPDLLLVYSRVAHHQIGGSGGAPILSRMYRAEHAMLRVVTPTGDTITTPIHWALAASILAVTHLNNGPGKQILLQINQTSSGATMAVFSLRASQLIPAAVLGAGGDSASAARFDCLGGNPPRVIQRGYELIHGIKLIGAETYGSWRETITTYAWHGPRLVKISQRSFTRRLLPKAKVGTGCIHGIR